MLEEEFDRFIAELKPEELPEMSDEEMEAMLAEMTGSSDFEDLDTEADSITDQEFDAFFEKLISSHREDGEAPITNIKK